MSSEKKEKKQHKMNFNIKEKLKKTFSKEHLKEVFTGEEQKKHLKQGSYSSIMTVIVLAVIVVINLIVAQNDFNAERRFREHQTSLLDCMELLLEEKESGESQPESVEALLDTVENEELLQILLSTDKKTLQMVVLKMMGYAPKEISHHMELPEQTVYTKLRRLREKIKKSMKFE